MLYYSDCHTHTHTYSWAKCPPQWCVFNSWHIAQIKAATKNREISTRTRYVLVLTKLKRYAKYGIHKLTTSLYITHTHTYSYVTQSRGAFRRAHKFVCVQITANTELLYFILWITKKCVVSSFLFFFFCFFLHVIFVACNVATWTAYFIYIRMLIWWKIHLQPTTDQQRKKNVTWQLWPNAVWRWSGPFKYMYMHMHIILFFISFKKSQNRKMQTLFLWQLKEIKFEN